MAVVPTTRIYEGTRIPERCPTILDVDPASHDLEDILTVNFGPNHPSTHGVLRLIVQLDGEHVAEVVLRGVDVEDRRAPLGDPRPLVDARRRDDCHQASPEKRTGSPPTG